MRKISFLLIFLAILSFTSKILAQAKPDTLLVKPDTILVVPDTISVSVDSVNVVPDTLRQAQNLEVVEPIEFSPTAASQYLKNLLAQKDLWRDDSNDSLKQSVQHLVHHYTEPFDSIAKKLSNLNFDSLSIVSSHIYMRDTLPLRWLNAYQFIVDTVWLDREPIVKEITIVKRIKDTSMFSQTDSLRLQVNLDELVQEDTTIRTYIDTSYLENKRVRVHKLTENGIEPSILPSQSRKSYRFSNDSLSIVLTERIPVLVGANGSPFSIVPNRRMPDSLSYAVKALLDYTSERDSFLLRINNLYGQKTAMWLSSGKEDLYRYWVKNSKNDSVTVWIGNPAKGNISLILEEDVSVARLERKMVDDVPFTTIKAHRELAKLKPLKEIPIYWTRDFSSSFSLSQNYLSTYWSKGGESSLASLLDINGSTEYNNKEAKTKWTTNGRLRYGTTWTDEQGFRTNTDILEINSQFNKVLKNKVDFSSSFYGKTQVAKGYNYPNDEEVVSKFFNPGTFTLGVGIEYKPGKKTTLNVSPLSYRNTFVLDTVLINQVKHGIEPDKRVRHEMGGQLVFRNSITILKDMKIENSIRLFTNYLNNPQNVDVDWELNLEKQVSIYFKVRLNMHFIYDDDIDFTILDGNGDPVLLPDGSEKKGAKPQFNQLLGLTLSFNI